MTNRTINMYHHLHRIFAKLENKRVKYYCHCNIVEPKKANFLNKVFVFLELVIMYGYFNVLGHLPVDRSKT